MSAHEKSEEKSQGVVTQTGPENLKKLIKNILEEYKEDKSSFTSASDAIKALQALQPNLDSFRSDEDLYKVLLLRIVSCPKIKKKHRKESFKQLLEVVPTDNIALLETLFLYLYKHNYFGESTHTALAELNEEVSKRKKAKEDAARHKKEEEQVLATITASFLESNTNKASKGRSRANSMMSVGSVQSLTSTVTYKESRIDRFLNGTKNSLGPKEEYALFGKFYHFLLRISAVYDPKDETSGMSLGKYVKMDDTQLAYYKDILITPLKEENDPTLPSEKALQDAFFKSDASQLKTLGRSKTKLEKDYPNISNYPIPQEQRVHILIRLIQQREKKGSIIVPDTRLADMVEELLKTKSSVIIDQNSSSSSNANSNPLLPSPSQCRDTLFHQSQLSSQPVEKQEATSSSGPSKTDQFTAQLQKFMEESSDNKADSACSML